MIEPHMSSCGRLMSYPFNFFINSLLLRRVLLAGSDVSGREFIELLISRKSGSTTPEQARDETQGESIRNLQATVEAQGRLLQAMADRLRIRE